MGWAYYSFLADEEARECKNIEKEAEMMNKGSVHV